MLAQTTLAATLHADCGLGNLGTAQQGARAVNIAPLNAGLQRQGPRLRAVSAFLGGQAPPTRIVDQQEH
jgi:hypothetical protein